jgi:hypothetical protein
MENTTEVQEELKLVVTEEMRSHIYDIAKWASFLAIVGFVITGLMIFIAFGIGAVLNTNPTVAAMFGQMASLGGPTITAVFLIYAFVVFYPSLLLFKYASKAKLGVLYGEQTSLDAAMGKMKSLFKFWGVMIIIFISLNIFSLISMVMSGVAAK